MTNKKTKEIHKFKKMTLTIQEVKTQEKIDIMGLFGTVWAEKGDKLEKIDFILNLNEESNKTLSRALTKLSNEAIKAKVNQDYQKEQEKLAKK